MNLFTALINKWPQMTLSPSRREPIIPREIIHAVAACETVSFDVFDTLVKRQVRHPEDVFSLTALQYQARYGSSPPLFRQQRILAERRARSASTAAEVTITEIYAQLDGVADRDKPRLMELEQSLELEVACANREMHSLFQWCLDIGKRVIVVSDMYLGEGVIAELLERTGYAGYAALYVSSNHGVTKAGGQLFEKIVHDFGLDPSKTLHLGDSVRSDWLGARSAGIRSILVRRHRRTAMHNPVRNERGLDASVFSAVIDNCTATNSSLAYRFGFEAAGPLLYAFCLWLRRQLALQGITRAYFVARDGFLMKKAFSAIKLDDSVEIRYLEVSRRSMLMPTLWMALASGESQDPLQALNSLMPFTVRSKTAREVLARIGLEKYETRLGEFGLAPDTLLSGDDIMTHPGCVRMFSELSDTIIAESYREFELFSGYLAQEQVSGKCGIIDIGWSGNCIESLARTLEANGVDASLFGYYLFLKPGISPKSTLVAAVRSFTERRELTVLGSLAVGLLESLFCEPAGPVKNYKRVLGGTMAVRYPSEHCGTGAESLTDLQRGAMDFIAEMADRPSLSLVGYSPSRAIRGVSRVALHPSSKEIEALGAIAFQDCGTIDSIAACRPLSYYLLHPRSLIADLIESKWRVAFLTQVFWIPRAVPPALLRRAVRALFSLLGDRA
jgi:predicted HAD superfamily hydrolase